MITLFKLREYEWGSTLELSVPIFGDDAVNLPILFSSTSHTQATSLERQENV